MNLFLDTNIYLGFFHYSNDDLEQLNKLMVLIDNGKCNLYLTDQVIDEYARNRENKILEALDSLKSQKLDFRFPQLCKDYPEFDLLRSYQRNFSDAFSALLVKVTADVNSMELKADKQINRLFDKAKHLKSTNEIIDKAKTRLAIGNPPGKKGSLGDAINWEILLCSEPVKGDLFFITDDNDFSSPLDDKRINPFLENEWLNHKKSEIIFYKSLSAFFQRHYPKIKVARDLDIEILIQELACSGNFASTHAIIAELNRNLEFSIDQKNSLIRAALSNDQVMWIINDGDIKNFFLSLIKNCKERLDQNDLQALLASLEDEPEDAIEEIPF